MLEAKFGGDPLKWTLASTFLVIFYQISGYNCANFLVQAKVPIIFY